MNYVMMLSPGASSFPRPALPVIVAAFLLPGSTPAPVAAQEANPFAVDGPPAPTGGATVNQAGPAGVTVRAYRVTGPIRIDGVVEEAFYRETPAITEFIQSVPDVDSRPTQRTEAWIGFDEQNVYVAAKVWDTEGPDGWIANEMRRDSPQIRSNDTFGVYFDTFHDRRNSVGFYGNAIGGMTDVQITNEGRANFDWNPVHQSRTAVFDGGWSIEMAIPFKSLRYRPSREQVWGIQMRRTVMRNNEWEHLRALPLSVAGNGWDGIFRVSMYGTLVGVEAPPPSRNIDVKPYGIAGSRTDLGATPGIRNDGYADAGLDVKLGITENLTADLTYNADFAQVEVDEQQVNLTRFSLFYPEKREFFLESRGIFEFGTGVFGGGGGGAPTLFYSRRIGLQGGDRVPITGGGRVTGKVGSFDVGLVNIQTGRDAEVDALSTNFSVVRLKRDLFARSNVGVLWELRNRSLTGTGANQAWGVDGSFGLTPELSVLMYYAQTDTEGLGDRDVSHRGQITYNGDTWGGSVDRLRVGEDFNPEMGFVRRKGFERTSASGRFSPRTRAISWIRQLRFEAEYDLYRNDRLGYEEEETYGGRFGVQLENGDGFDFRVSRRNEHFVTGERISGTTIPAGDYENLDLRAAYTFGRQRPYSGVLSVLRGRYYEGTLTSLGVTAGRIEVTPQVSVEPSVSLNWIDLPDLQQHRGQHDQHVMVTRVTYTLTPRAYVSALAQYNSRTGTFSENFRFRWEWAPGSELFVVYSEDRDTDVLDRWSRLQNRGLVIKVDRLLQL